MCTAAQHVLLFSVLEVNSDLFQILQSYTLLLKPPVLMCSCVIVILSLSFVPKQQLSNREVLRMHCICIQFELTKVIYRPYPQAIILRLCH